VFAQVTVLLAMVQSAILASLTTIFQIVLAKDVPQAPTQSEEMLHHVFLAHPTVQLATVQDALIAHQAPLFITIHAISATSPTATFALHLTTVIPVRVTLQSI
jgi:hypothetical protein